MPVPLTMQSARAAAGRRRIQAPADVAGTPTVAPTRPVVLPQGGGAGQPLTLADLRGGGRMPAGVDRQMAPATMQLQSYDPLIQSILQRPMAPQSFNQRGSFNPMAS